MKVNKMLTLTFDLNLDPVRSKSLFQLIGFRATSELGPISLIHLLPQTVEWIKCSLQHKLSPIWNARAGRFNFFLSLICRN